MDARLQFSSDKVANGGGMNFHYLVHKTTAGDYRLKLRISSAGVVQVSIAKVVGATETILVNRTLTGYTHAAGAKLQLRLQAVTAGGSTTLNAKAWADGTPEPADWFVTTTDAQAELQAAGQVGILAYLSGSATNAPVTVASTTSRCADRTARSQSSAKTPAPGSAGGGCLASVGCTVSLLGAREKHPQQ